MQLDDRTVWGVGMTILEIDSIELEQGSKTIFKDFSHSFHAGCHAVVGRNGIGKSTLLTAISGSHAPSNGHIRIDGIDLYSNPACAKQRLWYVPDNAIFYPFVSGREFLVFVLSIYGKGDVLKSPRYAELLDSLGLAFYLDIRFSEASLGTRIKFYLFVAFLIRPSLLIMDEPFNGLDVMSITSVVRFLTEFRDECAIVFSTHNDAIVDALDAKRLVLDGEPNIVFKTC
jgi:ABC-2 type transport system ATP-binding protein